METTDWASILGIAGGISASILFVYFAIALTCRLHRQSRDGHHPNKTHNRLSNMKITTNPLDQHNNDDPDIIINSNSGKAGLLCNKERYEANMLLYFPKLVQEQRSRISTTFIEQVVCNITFFS